MIIRAMTSPPAEHDELHAAPRALGDLLSANGSGTSSSVCEKDWTRLVASIAAGDHRALIALYERTHQIVFTLIVRITKEREAAEDVMLDVFHEVWRGAATYDPAHESVVAWVMSHARSKALERVRVDQQATHDVTEEERLVRNVLTVLTAEQRQTVGAAFFSKPSRAEMAEGQDEKPGRIRGRIGAALAKLRAAVARTVVSR